MKNQICYIGLASAAVSFLLYINCNFQEISTSHLYTDPQYGFRIATPNSGWTLTDETGIPEVLVIIKSDIMAEDFIPNVTIAIEFLPSMMTSKEYGKKNLKSIVDQGYEILSQGNTVIYQNNFYDLQCVNRHFTPSLRFRYLCLVKNRVGFIITCTATEEYYTVFIKDFEFIVSSFRFL